MTLVAYVGWLFHCSPDPNYRMIVATRSDGQPLPRGGLGPQWAVYEADILPAFKDKPLKERFGLCPWGLYHIDVRPPL